MDFDKYNPLSNEKIAEIQKINKLNAPRFLQIQKYPYQDKEPGSIITPVSKDKIEHYRSFENIFRELKWFEMRKPEEMPLYLKSSIYNSVYKVEKYDNSNGEPFANTDHPNGAPALLLFYVPATEIEYNNRKNK